MAAHGDTVTAQAVVWILREAHDLTRWTVVNFERADPAQLPVFEVPKPSQENKAQTKKSLQKLASQGAQMAMTDCAHLTCSSEGRKHLRTMRG